MHKLTAAAAVTAAASLGVMGIAYAASEDGNGAGGNRVLHLTVRQTQDAEIGTPNADSVLGLRFVGAHDVFDGARLVGHLGRSCEAVEDLDEEGLRSQCLFTLALEDGMITAQALPTFTEDGLSDFDAAVTGGTGAYRHARGVVAVDPVTQTEARVTVDLR